MKSKHTAKTQLPATIEGETGHEITFDLGSSGYALIDRGQLASRLMADGRPSQRRVSGIVRKGAFQQAEGRTITAKEITFAGFSLRDVPTDVTVEGFVAPSDISLGVNALSRFDLVFDIGGKRMWMQPNASYGAPFPHPVIGMDFRQAAQVHGLIVVGVAPGSPAERAGLRVSDRVVRVGGADATIGAVRALKAGDVVDFELADGSIRTVTAARFY